jgi:hypothetical protein
MLSQVDDVPGLFVYSPCKFVNLPHAIADNVCSTLNKITVGDHIPIDLFE